MSEHTTPQHWIDRVRTAAADRTPLAITGGGSKAFLGEAVGGEPLCTTDWRGIVSYEPTELVVTVRAGTLLAELESVLAERGQCLPFEPPHLGAGATVGGMVATGLSGPSRAAVGSVRDFVLGAECINGKGELLTFGGQVMKNVAGYDVSRLLAGSWGTLALISQVSLKVLPVAPAEATLVFGLPQTEALAQLHRWGGQPLPINASCWVRNTATDGEPELLFVRLRGAVAAVEAACQRMLADVPGQRMDNTQAQADWTDCREQRLPFFQPPANGLCLWRLGVPQTAPVLLPQRAQLVEWQGAQRWLWAPADAANEIRAAASAVGGHATLWFAPTGAAPGVPRFQPAEAAVRTINERLRQEFDPAGIFNPGRMG